MIYYPQTLRERIRHKFGRLLFGSKAYESPLMQGLFEHERKLRTDPEILHRRSVERREENRGNVWVFTVMVFTLGATLLAFGALLPNIADVSQSTAITIAAVAFAILLSALKRTLLPATPPWAFWTRYLAYARTDAERPAAAAPWLWLLMLRTKNWPESSRIVDAATGRTVHNRNTRTA